MPTYFGYVEREADSYINWAEIGKGISDTVNEIDKVRNEKKAALDQVSRDFQTKLSEYPSGQDKNANRFAYNYSDNASQFMLMQQRLLKQGKLKLKDYLNNTQNIMDDTETAFSLVKTYQEQYGKKMEQYRNGEISIAEVENFALMESFGGFTDTDLYINPLDGSVNLAKSKIERVAGKEVRTMAEGQENVMSVGVMKQLMNTPIPRYNMEKQSTAIADGLGKEIQIMMEGGLITSYEDIRRRISTKGALQSNDPDVISEALINAGINTSGISLTEITKKEDPTTKAQIEVKTTKTFDGREDELASEYVRIKDKPKEERTQDESNLFFQVEKSLKDSEKMIASYDETLRGIVQSNLNTPYNYMSALRDNNVKNSQNKQLYNGYTFDPKERDKNPNLILAKYENGTITYELTPEQKKDAEDAVMEQAEMRLDKKEEYKATYKTPEQIAEENALKRDELAFKKEQANKPREWTAADDQNYGSQLQMQSYAKFISDLYNGTDEEVETAIQHFKGIDALGIKDIIRTDEGIKIIYNYTDPNRFPKGERDFYFYTSGTNNPVGNIAFYNRISEALVDPKEKDRRGYLERGRDFLKPYTGHPNLNVIINNPLAREGSGIGIVDESEAKRVYERKKMAGFYPTGEAAGKTETITGGVTGSTLNATTRKGK